MTVEPENDGYTEKKRFGGGRKRKERAMRRNHLRELSALEQKSEGGYELNQGERGRLHLLREMYK